jgi:hypothetical protein
MRVLRAADHQAVGLGDRLPQRPYGCRKRHAFLIEIGIEMRQRGETVVNLDANFRSSDAREGAKQLPVRRVGAKTSGDGEEPHPES